MINHIYISEVGVIVAVLTTEGPNVLSFVVRKHGLYVSLTHCHIKLLTAS